MKNIFDKAITDEFIDRIEKLNENTEKVWGTMNVGQMLAHCNVTYELIYEGNQSPKPKGFKKFMLKALVKPIVVNEKPYKKNSRTAPDFLIKEGKDFAAEKTRLIDYMKKTQELGVNHFEGKESHSFGPLNSTEWNNMFVKHLDHHLSQFGV